MASERIILTLACSVCKDRNYYYSKGKNNEWKLEVKNFCRSCGKHTLHKETK
jgi:large subunit ribosomal protein L33